MIADNLADVRARVAAACARAGRDPADVGLIAVSKTFPASAIREAYAAGQRDFGESYAQELRDKARELADLDVRWHFIGRLQRNKAKYVAPVAFRVHAVDEVEQCVALAERRPGIACLVAVNVGGEETKGGVRPEETLDASARFAAAGVDVRGLMAIPPPVDDPTPYFRRLVDLAAAGRARGLALDELSMGMSHDYEIAIANGATWVRVGTAIFGTRAG